MKHFLPAVLVCAAAAAACVKTDYNLGQDFLSTDRQYSIHSESFPLEDIRMAYPEELSGFSVSRFTVGAVRNDVFGLSTRSAAFTLVPVDKTLDFGKAGTQVFRQFHFAAVRDTTSFDAAGQQYILQRLKVEELASPIDMEKAYPDVSVIPGNISDGVPVFGGTDSLSFNFNKAFGEKYMGITAADLESIETYTKKFPGIRLSCEEPSGNGGRINMFKLPIDVYNSYLYGSYAELKFSAEYDSRGQIDTSFVFYLGAADLYDLGDATSTSSSSQPQVALNLSTHSSQALEGAAGAEIHLEGGRGLKPVIKAASLREKVIETISKYGNPASAIISKASIVLPFDFPDDYRDIRKYPTQLSPTCRIAYDDGTVRYAGLSDASASDENQGDINRSLCNYAPDITHHIQELISADESKLDNYDIWMLAMAGEKVTTHGSSTSSDAADLYQELAYASYYSSLYGGDYYGGSYYDSYYNNYYNYMMLAEMMSQQASASTTSTQLQMDIHRFYHCRLHGPASATKKPSFRLTFAIPAE